MKILIVGAGNMGRAIGAALRFNPDFEVSFLVKSDISRYQDLKEKVFLSSSEINFSPDAIILAFKPQNLEEASLEVVKLISSDILVISILAGKTLEELSLSLNSHKKIIRSMPNLAIKEGQGLTAYFSGNEVTKNEIGIFKNIFDKTGQVIELENEDMIDAATAFLGSSPGFFFKILNDFCSAGESIGFANKNVKKNIIQILKGVLAIAENSDDGFKKLEEQVSSKGGTTEAGLSVLNENKISETIEKALLKSYQRAKDL